MEIAPTCSLDQAHLRAPAENWVAPHLFPAPAGALPTWQCHVVLTLVTGDQRTWHALTRDAFRQLRRGDCLADRGGRLWVVHAEPHQVGGIDHVVIRSGAPVRRVNERWAVLTWPRRLRSAAAITGQAATVGRAKSVPFVRVASCTRGRQAGEVGVRGPDEVGVRR